MARAFSSWTFPRFATDRLCLRTLRPGDEPFLVSVETNPKVMAHIHHGIKSSELAFQVAESEVRLAEYRVIVYALPDNLCSVRLVDKFEFKQTGDCRYEARESCNLYRPWKDPDYSAHPDVYVRQDDEDEDSILS